MFFTNLSTDKPCYKFIRVYKLCIAKLIRIINFQTDHNTIRPIRAIRRPLKRIGMENFIEAMPGTWKQFGILLDDFCWMLDDVGLAKKMCQFFVPECVRCAFCSETKTLRIDQLGDTDAFQRSSLKVCTMPSRSTWQILLLQIPEFNQQLAEKILILPF